MYSSRKNPYPPHGRSSEIPRGRRVLKAKMLEAKCEAKLGGGGGGGGVGCKKKPSSGTAQCNIQLSMNTSFQSDTITHENTA